MKVTVSFGSLYAVAKKGRTIPGVISAVYSRNPLGFEQIHFTMRTKEGSQDYRMEYTGRGVKCFRKTRKECTVWEPFP